MRTIVYDPNLKAVSDFDSISDRLQTKSQLDLRCLRLGRSLNLYEVIFECSERITERSVAKKPCLHFDILLLGFLYANEPLNIKYFLSTHLILFIFDELQFYK